jgi:polysaccharide deacetylase 2 family uncharacterized protein YibQ
MMRRRSRKKSATWLRLHAKKIRIFFIGVILLLLIRYVGYPIYVQRLAGLSAFETEQLIGKIAQVLQQHNIAEKWQKRFGSIIEVTISSPKILDEMMPAVENRIKESQAELIEFTRDEITGQNIVVIGRHHKIALQYFFNIDPSIIEPRYRVALIIDDFGYSYNQVARSFIFLNAPVTLSIIPGLSESVRIAQEAEKIGKEYLIHMPMEPQQESYKMDDYILLTQYDGETIRSRIRKAFSLLPTAVGMNNHQGSKFTSQRVPMEIALDEIKKHDKLFIDSHTSSTSQAFQIAKRMGVATALNDLFIDAVDESGFIEHQLRRLLELSIEKGQAVAIGHVHENTFVAIQNFLPEFADHNVQLVFISHIVR